MSLCLGLENGGNDGGAPCVLPFVYKRQTFYTCIDQDTKHKDFWCATTGDFDKDWKWSYCADTIRNICVFPFVYKDVSYSSCTMRNDKHMWCATSVDHDSRRMNGWKHCKTKEYGGNDGGRPCAFPFVFRGETFHTCINDDSQIIFSWCATTGSYDKDKKWSYCADTRVPGGTFLNKSPRFQFPFLDNIRWRGKRKIIEGTD
ncbi:epididymal sperm-binding protein 1-like isoform X1 [Zootoca vivipara]|uniref:epididymal sperm-binding protein 1-like isoform X1 n=1 Tax=Zootoca vivipara TaxID=8524 RepID=UPI00293BC457|nr:epididymal sperm-binding protein 1-like isoform X1 [Zootoca vivipara]